MKFKAKTYKGEKMVECRGKDCHLFKCWSPHDFNRGKTHHSGKILPEDWQCRTNHYYGCPDNPEIRE